ncbi:MAG: DsbC family protein [Steroidobacteraceae bacterium]
MNIRFALLCAVVLPLTACAQGAATPLAATASIPAAAARSTAAQAPVAAGDPRIALAAKIPGAKPEDLRATPVPGIFELSHGADISYITADASFVFSGDLHKVTNTGEFPNLSEDRRRELRLGMVARVPESQMLVFGPANAAHTITVFTDIDCPWCRKLHSEIDEYNKRGVRVRYLFYPRTGPDTESWTKAETVWCSADRKAAFTRAKLGKKLDWKACPGSPVAREYQLGQDIGITGTPGMVLDSGELVPGYMSPPELIAHFKEEAARVAAALKTAN